MARKRLRDRFLDPREGEQRTYGIEQTTGPRAGLKYDEILRDGRQFRQYDDAGTGLGRETIEVGRPKVSEAESLGAKLGRQIGTSTDGLRRGVTQSGRVVHEHADGRRVVMNEEQTQAALAKSPQLRAMLRKQRRGRSAGTGGAQAPAA